MKRDNNRRTAHRIRLLNGVLRHIRFYCRAVSIFAATGIRYIIAINNDINGLRDSLI